jgi:uncharacterized lipoprotein YddW (UPF0748 family)
LSQQCFYPSRLGAQKSLQPLTNCSKFYVILAGTIAGSLLHSLIEAPAVRAESPPETHLHAQRRPSSIILGVVRSAANDAQWSTLTAQLRAADIPYRMVDWRPNQPSTDLTNLTDITLLWLPGVASLSRQQVNSLNTWVNQGGYVITTGPVGTASNASIRRDLQSILARQPWDSQSSDATEINLTGLRGAIAHMEALEQSEALEHAERSHPVPSALTLLSGQLPRLTPFSSGDRPSTPLTPATPAPSQSAPATTATSDPSPEPRSETTPETPTPADTVDTVDPAPPSVAIAPPEFSSSEQPTERFNLASEGPRLTRLGPGLPPTPRSPSPEVSPQAPSPPSPSSSPSPLPTSAPSSEEPFDPAEQVAPPGLEVNRGEMPITVLEAIAMREELEKLIGRFESAILSANSANGSISLRVQDVDLADAVLIASTHDTGLDNASQSRTTEGIAAIGHSQEIVQQARQILERFPELVRDQEFARAREEWLQARDLLWNNFPTDRHLAQPEIRAIWLDRGTIVRAGSRERLAQLFDRLATAGINTVFFETVNAGYPIYPSRVAPQQNPLTRHWDPLAAAVELAHERGIELHAWVWVFAVGNERHNTLVNLPTNYPGPVLEAYPDWANYDHRGEIIPPGQTKPFLDPANPAVRRYLLRLFEEIVTQYDVDGLQLDYIRYPFQDPSARRSYGYGTAARQQFQRLTGVDPVDITPGDRTLWQRWTDFRTEQINSFVADTARLLRQTRPEVILSTAVFALSEHERIQKIQQNWEVWAQNGDVDLIVTMSYAMDTNRLLRLTTPWLNEDTDLGSTLILPGIRLLNLPESAALDQIQALRDMPVGGYALFAAENLDDNLQAIFSRIQGSNPSASEEPIPYRQPFHTAAARFRALKQEWSFALANQQLWIRSPQWDEWSTESEALGELLEQLAANPSPRQLRQAQQALSAFRAQFRDWMYLQTLGNGYRVRTWENRLAVIDDLLRYGERQVPDHQRARL